MKFSLAAVVALATSTSIHSFHLGSNKNIPAKESPELKTLSTDRRSFFSAALVTGGVGLLAPLQPANAYVDKDGKKVDRFGKPIPLRESIDSYKVVARDVPKKESKTDAKKNEKAEAKNEKLLAEAKEREEQERIAAEKAEEEKLARERVPPELPRVLVLGGTGTVGKKVRSKLEDQGFFVVATSRDGRDKTVELDVTKCYGKIEKEIFDLAKENKCSAVVSLIGAVGSESDGLINGATGQAALAASNVPCVRNFVAIGPSPSITTKVPKGLESYVKAKQLSQEVVMNTFKPDPKKDGMGYTIINPGAIGKSKNYGSDPAVPLDAIVNAVVVGATGFYLGEASEVIESVDDINKKAAKISKLKELKKK